ncbi:GEVED domain-containing protein [Alloscardovia omnicolens]|uniref:GEVED domain-containing protein n=1 Tax=Alloscardovia omnicolens TaxID=419015 RepID=UPI003A780D64
MGKPTHSSRLRAVLASAVLIPLAFSGLTGVSHAADLTVPDNPNHYQEYQSQNKESVKSAMNWVDFGQFTNLAADGTLQVGSEYQKEIAPGYVVHIRVEGLQPFNATDTYKQRVEEYGLADKLPALAQYDSAAQNYSNNGNTKPVGLIGRGLDIPNSNLAYNGISFDSSQKVALGVVTPTGGARKADWGVQLKVWGVYGGMEFPVDAVVADAEEANLEYVLATTDGEPFDLLTEISTPGQTKGSYKAFSWNTWVKNAGVGARGDSISDAEAMGFSNFTTDPAVADKAVRKEAGTDINGNAGWYIDGIGTQIFGPTLDTKGEKLSSPFALTRNVTNLGMYVRTHWNQAVMLGFLVADYGDAPESYGEARHLINNSGQPFIGRVKADVDLKREQRGVELKDWFTDDLDTLADDQPDEGLDQLAAENGNPVHYDALNKSTKIWMNPGSKNQAYARAWIDFNNNGVFDDDEASHRITVSSAGLQEITFPNAPDWDKKAHNYGVRVRIANDGADVDSPTGSAFSGEVEDFQLQVPEAETATSDGLQGQSQTKTVTFKNGDGSALTPSADNPVKFATIKNVDGKQVVETSDATEIPATKNGKEVGKYTIDGATGKITFTPNKDFVGTPDPANFVLYDDSNSPAYGTYTPTVSAVTPSGEAASSTGVQGKSQSGTPTFTPGDPSVPIDESKDAKFVVDGKPVDDTEVPAVQGGKTVGKYTIDPKTGKVTFSPNKDFVGTPDPVTVQRVDKNGTPATATYTPTVTAVIPSGEGTSSTGVQGQPQSGKPKFTPGDPAVPMDDDVPATFEDGKTEKTVDGVGTYKVADDGTVTFTPDKKFTGTAPSVVVKRVDKNGTPVTATYTPTVTPVTPSGEAASSTGVQGKSQSGTPTFTPGDPSVPIDESKDAKFVVDGKPVDDTEVPAVQGGKTVGKYTIDPKTGKVTFSPNKDFVGTPDPVTVQRVDKNGTPATATYTPTVTAVKPNAKEATSTGKQGQPQSGKPEFTPGDPDVPMDDDVPATFEDGKTEKTVDGVGTYTVAADGTVTFTPVKNFVGTAPSVAVKRVDKNGTSATATYTPTVEPVKPNTTPATSTGVQGQPQSGKPEFTPGDPAVPMDDDVPATFEDGKTEKTVDGVGTYKVAADGTVTFTPVKSYTGTAPSVTVKRVDKNGTSATATYTPTVTPVTPQGTPATSTGKQGQPQSGKPEFIPGDPAVPMDDDVPATFEDGKTEKTVDGVGTYKVAADGTVTFTPLKNFVGEAQSVIVKRVDKNGTSVNATYTPTVTAVKPTGTPATSTGKQGESQSGTPTFTNDDEQKTPLVPSEGNPARFVVDGVATDETSIEATKDGKIVGKYTIDPKTGTVTFTPNKSFVGEPDPATVQVKDANGTPAKTTYTPTVTPITPTGKDATSTGFQGEPQSGKPEFTPGDPDVPMDDDVPATFEDGSTTKAVPGEGTYTVAADGTVTFTPDKKFTGVGTPVTVKRVDKNGTPVTATYTPTVEAVTPQGTPATSTGKQGQPQSGTPTFTNGDEAGSPLKPTKDNPVKFVVDGKPVDDTEIPAVQGDKTVGKYTLNPGTGEVTFTPNKDFVGTPEPATVEMRDKNGTSVSTTYRPTVTAVTPQGTADSSTGVQGQAQSGKPEFTPGDPAVPMDDDVPATFEDGSTTKTVDGVGTYTVAADGTVTFTPDKKFTGDAPAVTVKRVDKNGTPATATYTPTVTAVSPTGTPATSTGKQGQPQSGKPTFTPGDPAVPMDDDVPATFEDGSKTKTVDGVGTYTVDPDGTVTFTPDKKFTGKAPVVTVKRVDKNGTAVTSTYTPTVEAVTPTGKDATSEGPQGVPQSGKPEFTPGDPAVPMDDDVPATFEDGSTTKTVPGEGTYTVDPDGTVTFTPDKKFTGVATSVTVKRVDKNGTEVTAIYKPTVTPVTPTGTPATSTGKQGQPQSGKPTFTPGDPAVPMDDDVPATFEDGSTTKTVDGVGTYTVDPDGTVTFTPDKKFTGTADPVTVKRVDKNGTEVTTQYRATVTPVTPTGSTSTSTGKPSQPQSGKPEFTPGDPDVPMDDSVPATFEDGSTTKVVPGEGTYTVDPDGTVTFKPEPGFVGKAKGVKVKRVDVNGTEVLALYQPVVEPETPEMVKMEVKKALARTGATLPIGWMLGLFAAGAAFWFASRRRGKADF